MKTIIDKLDFLPDDDIFIDDNLMIAGRDYQKRLTLEDSKLYCALLNLGGYTDWRLPIQSELIQTHDLFPESTFRWCSGENWAAKNLPWSSNTLLLCVPVRDI